MKLGVLVLFVPFLLGFIASTSFERGINLEMPLSDSDERISPYDRIKDSQIYVFDDKVVLQIKDASLAEYANTNSMDPLLDEYATGIEVEVKSEDELHVGDVVAYETDIGLIAHRIIEISYDNDGKYFILKGDNNNGSDPYKIRFNQIKYVLVGVIY
ncbi:hypothetical protein J4409_02880 [Candidatus Woesearchaeota archaeon]|nr:hypothetical protein [Candidatus Woesearchaeota archaeon]